MKEYVKQHVVPVSYLNRFVKKKTYDKGYFIGVRRIVNNEIKLFPKATDEIAYEENYYDVLCRDDSKYWERYFSTQIEPLYGQPLNNIISRAVLTMLENKILNKQEKIT